MIETGTIILVGVVGAGVGFVAGVLASEKGLVTGEDLSQAGDSAAKASRAMVRIITQRRPPRVDNPPAPPIHD